MAGWSCRKSPRSCGWRVVFRRHCGVCGGENELTKSLRCEISSLDIHSSFALIDAFINRFHFSLDTRPTSLVTFPMRYLVVSCSLNPGSRSRILAQIAYQHLAQKNLSAEFIDL